MRTVLLTLLAALVLTVLAGTAFIYSGAYDVSATRPHWPVTHWVLETAHPLEQGPSSRHHASGRTDDRCQPHQWH
jgi:hypothetical protein